MKRLITITSLLACAAIAGGAAVPPPAGYNVLKDNYILKDRDPGGTVGGTSIEKRDGHLPFEKDTVNPANGLPSIRVHNPAPGGDWYAMVTPHGWGTIEIAQYVPHGKLEFNVKGADGGEAFQIGFGDNVPERQANGSPASTIKVLVPIAKYTEVTKEWRHVAIPLIDLVPEGAAFDPRLVRTLEVASANNDPVEVWLNEIKVTSPDRERQFPRVKVNQVGYGTAAEKYAYVTGWPEDMADFTDGTAFRIADARTGKTLYSGKLALLTDFDPTVSGEKMLKADFSSVRKPGLYTIGVDGIPTSAPFAIGPNIYASLLTDVCRYYYYQRGNVALDDAHAAGFPHPAWHAMDAACPLQSAPNGTKYDVHGGWYDAGDFGKYVSAGATAVSDMLWTYEIFPKQFPDKQLNIPESGNGRSDLLDEIKVETDFFLRMQDPASGGFWSRVFPQDKNETRYISDQAQGKNALKPTAHTGSTVGALAHAAIVFRKVDPKYADTCLAAAKKGWAYLEANPTLVPSPNGPYHDDDDPNDRLYAAAVLCRASRNAAPYNAYFLAHYAAFANALDSDRASGHGVGGMELPAFLAYRKSAKPDKAFASWFAEHFAKWRATQLKHASEGFWNTSLPDQYYWGSNMPILTTSMDLVIGSKVLGSEDNTVTNVALQNFNYILGINPLSMSYVTGHGSNAVKTIFSGIYNDDGKPGTPPGYMPGGANSYNGAWMSRFTAKCFTDSPVEWTMNEHTIYWNSGLVFSAALAADMAKGK
jgi:endoglucanase